MSERLKRSINSLKTELREAGEVYIETKDKDLVIEISALTSAINILEEYVYGRRITTLLDSID